MTTTNTTPALSLLLSLAAGCVTDPADDTGLDTDLELSETTQLSTRVLGQPQIAVAGGTFDIRADKFVYVGYTSGNYKAVEADAELNTLRTSPSVPTSTVPPVKNLATDGTYVLFGDGAKNRRLSLSGAALATFDAAGVFGDSTIHGNGGIAMKSGTMARIMTSGGYALGTGSPTRVDDAAQPSAAALTASNGYVTPNASSIRLVTIDPTFGTLIRSVCAVSGTTYKAGSPIATTHVNDSGTIRVIAVLSDNRVVDCTYAGAAGSTIRTYTLPFTVDDLALEGGGGIGLEGGGGIGYEGGGGLGIWVSSRTTAEVAYLKSGTYQRIALPIGKSTTASLPHAIRSFSNGTAAVLLANGYFVEVAHY